MFEMLAQIPGLGALGPFAIPIALAALFSQFNKKGQGDSTSAPAAPTGTPPQFSISTQRGSAAREGARPGSGRKVSRLSAAATKPPTVAAGDLFPFVDPEARLFSELGIDPAGPPMTGFVTGRDPNTPLIRQVLQEQQFPASSMEGLALQIVKRAIETSIVGGTFNSEVGVLETLGVDPDKPDQILSVVRRHLESALTDSLGDPELALRIFNARIGDLLSPVPELVDEGSLLDSGTGVGGGFDFNAFLQQFLTSTPTAETPEEETFLPPVLDPAFQRENFGFQ